MCTKLGVLGAGQLARMMASEANELGVNLKLLAEDAHGCATSAIVNTVVGDFKDPLVVQNFSQDLQFLTFDHEHVPQEVLRSLTGVKIRPSPEALVYAQDKIKMRQAMQLHGFPNPRWSKVSSVQEILAKRKEWGAVVVKTPRGGYDGKGVKFIGTEKDAYQCQPWLKTHDELLVEEAVEFTSELSALCARNESGDIASWDVVQTRQVNGVCAEVIAPAPDISFNMAQKIRTIAHQIGQTLKITGVYAVEIFFTPDRAEQFLINELAMRPHNSGHWTQNGSITSQFEQHIRAVLDLPLGATDRTAPVIMMKNILGGPPGHIADYVPEALKEHQAKVHLYCKESRPGRKVGHINVAGKDCEHVQKIVNRVHDILQGKTHE